MALIWDTSLIGGGHFASERTRHKCAFLQMLDGNQTQLDAQCSVLNF